MQHHILLFILLKVIRITHLLLHQLVRLPVRQGLQERMEQTVQAVPTGLQAHLALTELMVLQEQMVRQVLMAQAEPMEQVDHHL